jgi:hypothetical protein
MHMLCKGSQLDVISLCPRPETSFLSRVRAVCNYLQQKPAGFCVRGSLLAGCLESWVWLELQDIETLENKDASSRHHDWPLHGAMILPRH